MGDREYFTRKEFVNMVEAYNKAEKERQEFKAENAKLQYTIAKIKEIAENCMSKDGCFECKYSDDCYIEDAEFLTYDICKLIIQKINEVEE